MGPASAAASGFQVMRIPTKIKAGWIMHVQKTEGARISNVPGIHQFGREIGGGAQIITYAHCAESPSRTTCDCITKR